MNAHSLRTPDDYCGGIAPSYFHNNKPAFSIIQWNDKKANTLIYDGRRNKTKQKKNSKKKNRKEDNVQIKSEMSVLIRVTKAVDFSCIQTMVHTRKSTDASGFVFPENDDAECASCRRHRHRCVLFAFYLCFWMKQRRSLYLHTRKQRRKLRRVKCLCLFKIYYFNIRRKVFNRIRRAGSYFFFLFLLEISWFTQKNMHVRFVFIGSAWKFWTFFFETKRL